MLPPVGIDFGTTNSAIARAEGAAAPVLVPLPGVDGRAARTWRTVLFFEPRDERNRIPVTAGGEAIARYLEAEGQGRFVQSIKSHLASELFSATTIFGRRYSIEELVATYLQRLRAAAGVDLGRRVVLGRPVRFWGATTPADDERAVARLRRAAELAGFDEVELEYEPVAAAHHYASTLDHDELVLIADLGGGTTDFSLVRVGPARRSREVLATGGLGVGGDAFDGRLIDHVVAPLLGKDTSYEAEFGRSMPVPPWLYTRLRRWHHLSFLRSPETTALLEKIAAGASHPERIERLVRLIDDELGLPLHQAIETTKVALSGAAQAPFRFAPEGLALEASATRSEFEAWIDEDLAAIDATLDGVLATAGVAPADIDRVFATGGSSFVPAVRKRLADRFGGDRVVGGDELISVASGLAEAARLRF